MPLVEVALSKEVAVKANKTVKRDEGGMNNVVIVDLDLFCLF